MSWNYRVFRTQYRTRLTREKEYHLEEHWTFREVYYDDETQEITGISSGIIGISPSGTNLEELRGDIDKMWKALVKLPLTPRNVSGYIYDENEIPFNEELEKVDHG